MVKYIWIFALAVLMTAGTVSAQIAEVTSVTADSSDATVTIEVQDEVVVTTDDSNSIILGGTDTVVITELEGVEVKEVKKMPTTWGLWWTSVKEKVSEITTLDPVKKAEKRLRFAEQRMKYAEYIADNAKDPKKQAKAQKMMEKANNYMEKVEAAKEKWTENLDDRKKKLIKNVLTHQVRREKVMDKLEEKLPEDKLEALQKMRVKAIENSKRLVNALDKQKISTSTRAHLQAVKTRVEGHLQNVKNYQVKKKVLLEKAKSGDETAKDDLKDLNNARKEKLKINIERYKDVKSDLRKKVQDGSEAAKKKLQIMNKVENKVQQVKPNQLKPAVVKPAVKKVLNQNKKPLPVKVKAQLKAGVKPLPVKKPLPPAPVNSTDDSDSSVDKE